MTNDVATTNDRNFLRVQITDEIQITGPGQMMTKLRSLLPEYKRPDVLFVWLDEKEFALAIDKLEIAENAQITIPTEMDNFKKLIIICRSESRSDAAETAKIFDLNEIKPLDVLLIAQDRWWSNLCSDSECCPVSGRLMPGKVVLSEKSLSDRHDVWLQWLKLINQLSVQPQLSEISYETEELLRRSLDDLAIRDCVLNHIATNPQAQPTWTKIFERFLDSTQSQNNHVVYCLLAAIHFSNNRVENADHFTKQSLLINPEYSLSLLMQHGLEIKMDCKKVVAAFTHFSADELLKNTPLRK